MTRTLAGPTTNSVSGFTEHPATPALARRAGQPHVCNGRGAVACPGTQS